MTHPELRAQLETLLDAYLAEDIADTLVSICRSRLTDAVFNRQGIKSNMYWTWCVAFIAARRVIRAGLTGKVREVLGVLKGEAHIESSDIDESWCN